MSHQCKPRLTRSGTYCSVCDRLMFPTGYPKYERGQWVVRGKNGKVPLEVIATITTGRVITYDLISRGTTRKLYVAVPEPKLYPHIVD